MHFQDNSLNVHGKMREGGKRDIQIPARHDNDEEAGKDAANM